MKITIYTITDCQFSKQEKEYLKSHNLPFEEKNLETNREFLTEMLTISNNFAGTPVTKVDKDDGQIAVLKGFTEKEFNDLFGFSKPEEKKSEETKPAADAVKPVEVAPAVAPAIPEIPSVNATNQPKTDPQGPISTEKPVDPMTDVLKTLETQAAQPQATPPITPPSQEVVPQQATDQTPALPATPAMPSIPNPQL